MRKIKLMLGYLKKAILCRKKIESAFTVDVVITFSPKEWEMVFKYAHSNIDNLIE